MLILYGMLVNSPKTGNSFYMHVSIGTLVAKLAKGFSGAKASLTVPNCMLYILE